MLPEHLLSVDLGQSQDFTAIAVLERRDEPTGRRERHVNIAAYFDSGSHLPREIEAPQVAGHYAVTHLERLPLGTAYTELPGRLAAIEARVRQAWVELAWRHDAEANNGCPARYPGDASVELIVDKTGVGAPVVDLLREAGLDPVSVTITGGDEVTEPEWREVRVPKRNLAAATQVALQTRRLRIAKELPDAAVLRKELENFRARISLSGHDSYGAGEDWRKENHDDLVLAVAMAVWYGDYRLGKVTGHVVGWTQ